MSLSQLIKEKLQEEVDQGAVICLQEVLLLHVFNLTNHLFPWSYEYSYFFPSLQIVFGKFILVLSATYKVKNRYDSMLQSVLRYLITMSGLDVFRQPITTLVTSLSLCFCPHPYYRYQRLLLYYFMFLSLGSRIWIIVWLPSTMATPVRIKYFL